MRRNTNLIGRFAEPLESRRLFSDLALSIDETKSTIAATGTVNSVALSENATGSLTGSLGGTLNVSSTKRGIKFQSGSSVTVTPSAGSGAAFTFSVPGGTTVDVSGPDFDFTSGRLRTFTSGKFSVANIDTSLSGGSINVTGQSGVATLTGATATINYAVGHVKRSDSSLRVIMPYSFTVSANYTVASVPQTFDVTLTGVIEAGGQFADGASFVAKQTPVETPKKDRVVSDVVG